MEALPDAEFTKTFFSSTTRRLFGVTGPDLFPTAVAAFKKILDDLGADYQ